MTSYTCKQCDTTTSISSSVTMESFGCPSCKALYVKDDAEFRFKSKFSYSLLDSTIPVGKKCQIGNETYEVTGMLVKHLGGLVYAREYTLQSNLGNYKYLSECEGHWILLKEIDDIDFNSRSRLEITYNDRTFKKYSYYNNDIVLAQGFFDVNLKEKSAFVVEYISPPFILCSENLNELHFYLGEHISKKEVKRLFNLEAIPSKSGVGVVQPFPFHVLDTIKIFLITAIVILTCYIFQGYQENKKVVGDTISINEYVNKEYVSPSFEVVDIAVPIKITLHSEVSNSWAYAGVSVVNEVTNEEEFAEQDIEFYSGYEDGYHWTEGSQSANFHICGLKPGKYHLVVSPSAENIIPNVNTTDTSALKIWPPENVVVGKTTYDAQQRIVDSIAKIKAEIESAAESSTVSSDQKNLTIYAELESPSSWNFGISLIVLIFFTVAILVYRHFFESWRWSDSSYSPYI